ncbi:MAG: hypothetical protein ACTHW2_11910 [Tissierella sp.]|uniref:hypothetical protein n=1 Tax=Tissierella sp. TaxID=41274 RepID=UPI003F959837
MKNKNISWIVFILSTVSFLISLKLFWNLGIYVDEYSTSMDLVYGGEFWIYMGWLKLFMLGFLSMLSLVKLFDKQNN